VPNGLCEKEVPTNRIVADGHQIKCHLTDTQLAEMEPVIEIAAE
jgi:peptide/nickel transport system ATP-binding protein